MSASPIPVADPHGEVRQFRAEIAAAVSDVIDSGRYILGPKVAEFEQALSRRVGAQGAVGVGCGTDALVLALLASDVARGDEVITVSHTAGPTIAAIRMIGAVPVLIDVEEDSYNLDPTLIEAAIGPRTRAVLPVHLYGHPANMTAIAAVIADRQIAVIEDCAQALDAELDGRRVGSFGTFGCFSFYPTKHLGALGDGGAICANDAALLDRLAMLRVYGWEKPQYSVLQNGRCSRLDEIQAAILMVKLKRLTANLLRRREIAERYRRGLADLPLILPRERPSCTHSYQYYVVRTGHRDALEAHLRREQIGTARHYPLPAHRQPGLAAHARIPAPLAVTERIMAEILSLPMFSTMTDGQVDRVVEAVQAFHGRPEGA